MKAARVDTQLMLDALKQAVEKALDRKRRLGQYAVFWKDGKAVFTEGDTSSSRSQPFAAQEDLKKYER